MTTPVVARPNPEADMPGHMVATPHRTRHPDSEAPLPLEPTPADEHPGGAWAAEDILREIFFPSGLFWRSIRRGAFRWESYLGMMPLCENADGFGGIVRISGLRIAAKSTLGGWRFSLPYVDANGHGFTWREDTVFWNAASFRRARVKLAYIRCWNAITQDH